MSLGSEVLDLGGGYIGLGAFLGDTRFNTLVRNTENVVNLLLGGL